MKVRYELAKQDAWLWCKSHRRIATHWCIKEDVKQPNQNPREIVCDPGLSGILLPCKCGPFRFKFAQPVDNP